MTEKLGGTLPVVVQPVNVGDRQARQLLFRDSRETAKINAIHLANGRFGSDTERSNAAVFAEIVMVLLCVEHVLSQFRLSFQETKTAFSCYSRPKTIAPADGAIAAIRALLKIKVGFELHRAAMAATLVGFQHGFAPMCGLGSVALIQGLGVIISDTG